MYNTLKLSKHPYKWVKHLVNKELGGCGVLEFSKYNYVPRTINDYRYEFKLNLPDFNEKSINYIISNLEPGLELAINSRVSNSNAILHIPMIDFGIKLNTSIPVDTLLKFVKYWNMNFILFSSGRSYHAYGDRLLEQNEWINFMGSLLLINIPGERKLIDDRWVGHRLLAGYSSLRWSNNTSHYKKYPSRSGFLTHDNLYINESNSINMDYYFNY
ncbi:primase 1D-like protein [Thorsellia kenyensis]|uniref:Uncharacterized protein n=1 Tax=Thorsellia kenyensis TaxID=1549888 RepID=A0ABV6C6G2_9GAMM